MEPFLAVTVGCFFAVGIYLLMSKHIVRILMGVVILGNGVNMLIFTSGRLTRDIPPVIPPELDVPEAIIANPLPQALILTAIVIAFSLFAFLLVLAYRAYQVLDTDNSKEMRLAEPKNEPMPPLGY
jgi:multicomponent Na+:H+ antiporter subunit C